ncbi:MAG: asparaginase [Deinococcales bacterium]
MKRLAIIQTGGTIASQTSHTGDLVPANAVTELLEALPGLKPFALTLHQPFNLPSPHITPEHMLELRDVCAALMPTHDGIVITHGTDTLEETAFFLHLTLQASIPVVLTGSMRHAEEPSWDGPGNVLAAAHVALEPRSKGVLVVFGGDIFDARTVTKSDTTRLEAFAGYPGPIGRIDFLSGQPKIAYFAAAEARAVFAIEHIGARVEVLYAYAGWHGEGLAEALTRADGVVIAALGTGNVPPDVVPIIQAAKKPIVIATRTHNGAILPVYGYVGGGKQLRELGAIPASFLNAHKARILLLVVLSQKATRAELERIFLELEV